MDGINLGGSCDRGSIGGEFCSGELGSDWMRVGGERNEKSSGTPGFPSIV